MAEIHFRLEFSPAAARWGLAGLFMIFHAQDLGSETVTMTTYYPAPSGVYNRMITTDSTWLARDSGVVTIGNTSNVDPNVKLDVAGVVKLGSIPADPAIGVNGAIYYNSASANFRGFKGGAWTNLGGGPSIPNMAVFATPGSYSWTAPAGVTRIMVELWGGGGGGNAGVWCNNGVGAGGGAFGRGVYAVTPGTTYGVVVGIGGPTDSNGGASSFSSLIIAQGGAANGVGGVSAAPFNCPGQSGKIKFIGAAGCGGGQAGDVYGQYPATGPGGGGGCGSTSHTGGPGRVVVYY